MLAALHLNYFSLIGNAKLRTSAGIFLAVILMLMFYQSSCFFLNSYCWV